MVVRVFVAGGSGALGRRLVPQLVARGHRVTATATGPAKLSLLARLGADAVVMDGLDAVSVGEAVAAARPDAVVDQMTALSAAHAGKPDLKHPDRFFATIIRLRSEGTDHLLAAAEATGVSHVVAQSFGAFNGIREGGWVKAEENPVDPGPARAQAAVPAGRGRHRLHVVGASRRRGERCRPGPGARGGRRFQHRRRRTSPGQRVAALSGRVRWGEAAGAGSQVGGPAAGRGHGGDHDDRGRGCSNAKAKRELGWQPRYPSWRQGFKEELA